MTPHDRIVQLTRILEEISEIMAETEPRLPEATAMTHLQRAWIALHTARERIAGEQGVQ